MSERVTPEGQEGISGPSGAEAQGGDGVKGWGGLVLSTGQG